MSREASKLPTLSDGIAVSQTTALLLSISCGIVNKNPTLAGAVHPSLRRRETHCLKGSEKNLIKAEGFRRHAMNSSRRRNLAVAGVISLVVIALIVGALRPKHASGAGTAPPPDVMVAQVEQMDVPIYGEWIGTLDGFVNADVRAQVTGYLVRQDYKEGAFVNKGQLLFEIDPRPFQAALDQAEGQLAQAKAQLTNAEAVQVRTQLDVERYAPLAREQAASQQDLDNATQNNLAAKATVATDKAQIKTAEAAVETAKLNLGFTQISSPVDGIADVAKAQVGDLVSSNSG